MLDPDHEIASVSPGHELLVPPPKQKRSSVACRRCRRLRAKCVKDEEKGLCRGCIEAGVPNECQFLPRGMSAIDRAVSDRRARRIKHCASVLSFHHSRVHLKIGKGSRAQKRSISASPNSQQRLQTNAHLDLSSSRDHLSELQHYPSHQITHLRTDH